jgi:hypothetical protein
MTTRLKGPEHTGGFGYAGQNFEPDADGIIDIPDEFVQEAKSHGFIPVSEITHPDPAVSSVNLQGLTNKQLVAFAQDALGLTLDPSLKKKDLIASIEAAMAEEAPATDAGAESAAA